MMSKSFSEDDVSIFDKLSYLVKLLRRQFQRRSETDFTWLKGFYVEYDSYIRKYSSTALQDCRIMEIGFGARPYRLRFLLSKGIDVKGIDADHPMLAFGLSGLRDIVRRNGVERAAKTLSRYVVLQRHEEGVFRAYLKDQGLAEPARAALAAVLSVGDASHRSTWPDSDESYDLIYSEDVFEHIPTERLREVTQIMARALKPQGIALIRPNIYTGLCGGHDPD